MSALSPEKSMKHEGGKRQRGGAGMNVKKKEGGVK
jgi:hypothetical protein